MPDRDYRTLPLTFERGLVETVEDSMLPPGACAKCQNWVPDPSGNLRVRRGWLKASTTSAPAAGSRKGIGIGYFSRQITPSIIQASTVYQVGDLTAGNIDPLWPVPTTKGSLLILVKVLATSDATTTDVTPTSGTTAWTNAVVSADTSARPRVSIWYKANAPSESGVVSNVTWAGTAVGVGGSGQLFEISGITTTSPVDQTASTNAALDATPDSGTTAATTQAVEFCIAALVDEANENQTSPTNSFLQHSQGFINSTSSVDVTEAVYYKGTTATGAQSVSATTATANDVAGAIATFKGWFTGTPAVGQAAGRDFLVANNETTEIEIYKLNADDLAAGTWSSVEAVTVTPSIYSVAFAPGLDRIFYTHPNFTSLRQYNGVTASSIATGPSGRCVAFHKNRVFVGGSEGAPSRLYFSEVGDADTWSGGTAGFIEVGNGDGEAIEDISPFEDGLVIGKKTSLWYLLGSGPDNHKLIRLPSQSGIAPGRTITPTPYGAILAGRKNLMIFSGGSVVTYSGAIVDTYGLTDDWMSGAVVNDFYYCLDQGSGTMWVLDLTEGVWHTEIVGTGTEMPAVLYNYDDTLLFTPVTGTVDSLLQYRLEPGSTRQKDYATLSQVFEAWTPEIWPVGPEEKITPRHLFLKLRQRNGDVTDTGLTITPVYDGRTQTARTIIPKASAGVYWVHKSIGEERGISSFQLKFTQTVPDGDIVLFDIEEATIGFDIEKKAGA